MQSGAEVYDLMLILLLGIMPKKVHHKLQKKDTKQVRMFLSLNGVNIVVSSGPFSGLSLD